MSTVHGPVDSWSEEKKSLFYPVELEELKKQGKIKADFEKEGDFKEYTSDEAVDALEPIAKSNIGHLSKEQKALLSHTERVSLSRKGKIFSDYYDGLTDSYRWYSVDEVVSFRVREEKKNPKETGWQKTKRRIGTTISYGFKTIFYSAAAAVVLGGIHMCSNRNKDGNDRGEGKNDYNSLAEKVGVIPSSDPSKPATYAPGDPRAVKPTPTPAAVREPVKKEDLKKTFPPASKETNNSDPVEGLNRNRFK